MLISVHGLTLIVVTIIKSDGLLLKKIVKVSTVISIYFQRSQSLFDANERKFKNVCKKFGLRYFIEAL